jgi:hypothetical protein
MSKFYKAIGVVQERYSEDAFKKRRTMRRMNPYNPLTYVAIVIIVVMGIVLFGVIGFKDEIDLNKPFTWR